MKFIQNKKYYWLLLVYLLINWQTASAVPPVIIGENFNNITLSNQLEYLEDVEQKITFHDIQNKKVNWLPIPNNQVNFGYSQSIYWLHFSINNETNQPKDLYLEATSSLLNFIELYKNNNFFPVTTGTFFPLSSKEINNRYFLFNIKLNPGINDFHIKIRSTNSLNFSLNLWEKQFYLESNSYELFLLGLYYGALLLMIVYNFIIYFFVKDKSYLFCVLFIIFFTLLELSLNGFAWQYLWPNSTWLASNGVIYIILLINVFLVLYIQLFLNFSKNFPKSHKALNYFNLAPIIPWVFILFYFYDLKIIKIIYYIWVTMGLFLLLSTILYAFIKKNRGALFIMWGFLALLIGSILTVAKSLNLISDNWFISSFMQISSLTMIIMFSLGLADKINSMRTEVLLLNHDLVDKNKKLENLDKIKNDFISIASHELRTPLGVIKGYISILISEHYDKATQLPYLDRIMKNVNRLLSLVNDMLDLNKLESGNFNFKVENINLTDFLADISNDFEKMYEHKNISLKVVNNLKENCTITFDKNSLMQVFINLLGNAYKFTPENGQVEIIVVKEVRNLVEIHIKDSGIGIPADKINKVFDKFSQIDNYLQRDGEGTGLGLSIVKHIIEKMGGEIWVNSQENVGTTFAFTVKNN